jgi:acyl-CoA dehydrogenase
VKAVEATDDRVDRALWAELANANLLGVCLPEEHGGSGLGLIELCLFLEQQGRRVAPVPLLWTLVSAMAIAEFGTPEQQAALLPGVIAGDVVLTAALNHGLVSVPAAPFADAVLVPVDGRLQLARPQSERAITTDRSVVGHLDPNTIDGEPLGDERAVRWLTERAMVGLCALQVGVAEEALAQAAAYTSGRHQFGKPLSTFQGVAHKAADAYIDIEAMRVTLWQAAWRLAEGRDATKEVLVAKWWAAEGGQHVVHIVQHLHGGIGADVEYPVHRYFLWGKPLEVTLGGASQTLARLGHVLVEAGA